LWNIPSFCSTSSKYNWIKSAYIQDKWFNIVYYLCIPIYVSLYHNMIITTKLIVTSNMCLLMYKPKNKVSHIVHSFSVSQNMCWSMDHIPHVCIQ
jgi:hypothetical protein